MKINEFLAEINMLPEAVHLLNELQESGRIGEEEYQENKLLYEKDRALFYEKILLEKDYRLVFLYYLCRMGAETYDAYEKRGISREIFRDTFYDLTFWCENCFLEYGEYGIDEYDWFFRHMKLTIFTPKGQIVKSVPENFPADSPLFISIIGFGAHAA